MKKLGNKETSISRRYIINIYGTVQGVGFRPYVYNLARRYDLKGWIKNAGSSVGIDIEGRKENIKSFLNCIINNPPPLSSIKEIKINHKQLKGYKIFEILKSTSRYGEMKFISPDVRTCEECKKEIFDKNSPYYKYPFTNCTNCGPRYSIIKKLPYDRENTTMKKFKMCTFCREEYENPTKRRFHAQPTCCPACGPKYKLIDISGNVIDSEDPIEKTKQLLKMGYIIAIKGIGGFHLACNGEDYKIVSLLRKRKKRPHKPFAVMAKDMEVVKKVCYITEKEQKVLSSRKRPIVILRKKETFHLPENIAPMNKKLGVILPYAPVHYLLFDDNIKYLIMTSGNISSMPIQYINNEALKYLKGIADFFLIHDRDINIPVEDAVVKVIGNEEVIIRMGRGYSPFAVDACVKSEILALGGDKKASFSISQKGYVYLSQYFGDLKDLDTYNNYKNGIKNLTNIFNLNPKIVVHDLHPNYLSTQYAQTVNGNRISVQHHHSHMVSCIAEHKITDDVIGVIFDGTGMGTDGSVWGGEFFGGNRNWFKRVAHLKPVYIQGGDTSIKEPWRIALSYLVSMGYDPRKYLNGIDNNKLRYVENILKVGLNCYKSSSMGRFFDCVASLIGLRNIVTYEGQGAIELENIIVDGVTESYDYNIEDNNGLLWIDYNGIIAGILKDLEDKVSPSIISAKFHNTVCSFTVETVCRIRQLYNINLVVLSGGVFQNDFLLKNIYKKLNYCNFKVYYNQKIPINDNGISFGQLISADSLMGE